jgi:hypothetical protein
MRSLSVHDGMVPDIASPHSGYDTAAIWEKGTGMRQIRIQKKRIRR